MSLDNNIISFENFDTVFLLKSKNWLKDKEIAKLINLESFNEDKQSEWFSKIGTDKSILVFGVQYNDIAIGACGLKKITENSAEYWGYIGEKAYWGKGIGKLIVNYCIEKAKSLQLNELQLNVIDSNTVAINLYMKTGFEIIKEENNLIFMKFSL